MQVTINCPYCCHSNNVQLDFYIDDGEPICSTVHECAKCKNEIAFSITVKILPVKVGY